MKIKRVEISNILSIEHAVVEFDDNGLMLVQGWNHDTQRANGAGKTAIFNAISYALYDKLPRKITATEIVRRGYKTGYAEVCLDIGGLLYTVRRSRPKGVAFFEGDGVHSEPLVMTQEEWESKLRLNYTQYIMAAYCSQGTSARFLSVNDADKKTFLLQLLNLEEFSSCRKIADEKVKTLTEQNQAISNKIDTIESKVDAYSESLIDEAVVNHHIELLNKDIVSITGEIRQAQAVSKPDLSKFSKLEDDIVAKKTEFTRARTKREILHDTYRRTRAGLRPFTAALSCSECGSALDITAAKAQHDKLSHTTESELSRIKAEIDECDALLAKESSVLDLATKIRDKKKEESRDYEIASIKIMELQSKLAMKQKDLKDLSLKLSQNSDLESKIKVLIEAKDKLNISKANIFREIELYKTISSMYSPTGAQAYILDSVVESFNSRVSEYVDMLWSNVTYELKTFKENVKGDVSAKFSENLIFNGKPVSIGSLSGGEFRALSLCVDFALVDVLESQFGIHVTPIVLDEPFDGLDLSGRELIIELLEKLSRDHQIVVIDHASEVVTSFSNVLSVEKSNGISKIYKTT